MNEKKKESRSGMEIMNLLQVCHTRLVVVASFFSHCEFISLSCVQKEGRQRGTWNGKKTDNDFYKKIVCEVMNVLINLICSLSFTEQFMVRKQRAQLSLINICSQVDACEAKNQELMQENNDLRALLRSMQVGLCSHMCQHLSSIITSLL